MGVYLPAQGSLQSEISRELPIRNVTLSNQAEKGEQSGQAENQVVMLSWEPKRAFQAEGAKAE